MSEVGFVACSLVVFVYVFLRKSVSECVIVCVGSHGIRHHVLNPCRAICEEVCGWLDGIVSDL